MGIYTIRMPDVGEGIAEAELSEWEVKVGDFVKEDDVLSVVMTDKAAIEVPSSVDGRVTWLGCVPGDTIAIGAPLIKLEITGEGDAVDLAEQPAEEVESMSEEVVESNPAQPAVENKPAEAPAVVRPVAVRRNEGEKPLASPAVRKRALDEGVDLRQVSGSGPAGRISHEDLDAFFISGPIVQGGVQRGQNTGVVEIKMVGMRRKIAEKMALSKSRIPHITIVEEVDVSSLEDLRGKLNEKHAGERTKLTILPFMMRAIVEAVREQPEINAHFDDDAGVISQYGVVHIGVATQTPAGLTVPVSRHAEAMNPWEAAAELARLAEAARAGKATRDELSGSTITITSLGPLGAIATTPIINHPEVAIVGINKIAIRPVWDGQQFQPRKMMNISCAFDHRVIDGWDAAVFVQKLKNLLETPAMLFVEA